MCRIRDSTHGPYKNIVKDIQSLALEASLPRHTSAAVCSKLTLVVLQFHGTVDVFSLIHYSPLLLLIPLCSVERNEPHHIGQSET